MKKSMKTSYMEMHMYIRQHNHNLLGRQYVDASLLPTDSDHDNFQEEALSTLQSIYFVPKIGRVIFLSVFLHV